MAPQPHIPSLTHLRDFARSRAAGRQTHVALDKAQVTAPREDRFPSFAYERFLTSTIAYVTAGRRSDALERAYETGPQRMAASYQAAARGLGPLLDDLDVVAARRRQHNVVVLDPGTENGLVSLRLHLLLDLADSSTVAAHLYFPAQALTPVELQIMESAVTLAAEQIDPALVPAIIRVRSGSIVWIGDDAATADRIDALRAVSTAYQDEWDSQE